VNAWLNATEYSKLLPVDNSMRFLSPDGYYINACHFWNNFEIASFSLFRNDIYASYFDWLDRTGGFYLERWGDAPVHTYYIVLMLRKRELHRFYDISYGHAGIYNWPLHNVVKKCGTSPKMTVMEYGNCTKHWDTLTLFD
jgi:alpha 1,2-mannosyltransferase